MHAVIRYEDGVFTLVDLDSQGGTRVNGTPTSRVYLDDRDRIIIGDSRLRFRSVYNTKKPSDTV